MKKLLFISSFPFNNPRHGGQIRSLELKKFYEKLGYVVKVLVIRPMESYRDDHGDYEFMVPVSNIKDELLFKVSSFLGDYLCHDFVVENLTKIIKKTGTDYDVIHCEMPWLFPVAYEIKRTSTRNPIVILGTENIESVLKARILLSANQDQRIVTEVEDRIRNIELNAAKNSDLVLVVSQNDYDYFKGHIDAEKLILVKNGISENRYETRDSSVLKSLPENYFVFVGSAHYPNASGFAEIFSKSLAFLPPDVSIVVIGGVSDILDYDFRYVQFKHLNDFKVIKMKDISDACLNSIILNCNAVLLPVTEGGGTNLKTAEALFSNRPVISTDKSFIGYEDFKSSEGVYTANNPEEFISVMRMFMYVKENFDRKDLQQLTWSSNFRKFEDTMRKHYEKNVD